LTWHYVRRTVRMRIEDVEDCLQRTRIAGNADDVARSYRAGKEINSSASLIPLVPTDNRIRQPRRKPVDGHRVTGTSGESKKSG
jgi:hypothetical protein